MHWNNNRNPGEWQGNTGYANNQGNWEWGSNYPNTSGDWGQGYNQGNWGGAWVSNQQPWTGQAGWQGNQNWGPWNSPGFSGHWAPWSNSGGNYNPWNQGFYGQGDYGPWNTGFNNQGFGYGTAHGYGPMNGYGPNFNMGYGYGPGWGNYGQGFGNYPFGEYEGEFAGVGPQNYRRSDQRIEEDVCDELTADSHVDAHDVNVSVNSSVVTLTGTVPTREMRRRAEEDAESVMGVADVRNDLRIGQHEHAPPGMIPPEQTTPTQTRTRNTSR